MNEYLMIFRNEPMEGKPAPSPEQIKAVEKMWQDWIVGIAKQGKYSGTNRLTRGAKMVRPGKMVTDGPYMEGKELVGGYLLVTAGSLEEATEMAQGCPTLLFGGNVEVRTVMNVEHDTASPNFLCERK